VGKGFKRFDTKLKLIEKSNAFEDRRDLDKVEQQDAQPLLSKLFE
jgi:hypothetical protein